MSKVYKHVINAIGNRNCNWFSKILSHIGNHDHIFQVSWPPFNKQVDFTCNARRTGRWWSDLVYGLLQAHHLGNNSQFHVVCNSGSEECSSYQWLPESRRCFYNHMPSHCVNLTATSTSVWVAVLVKYFRAAIFEEGLTFSILLLVITTDKMRHVIRVGTRHCAGCSNLMWSEEGDVSRRPQNSLSFHPLPCHIGFLKVWVDEYTEPNNWGINQRTQCAWCNKHRAVKCIYLQGPLLFEFSFIQVITDAFTT